jgi:hypothetical protein
MTKIFSKFIFTLALAVAPAIAAQASDRQAEGFKLERGGRVSIVNNAGQITVRGWDRDTIEASAIDDDSTSLKVQITGDARRARVALSPERRYGAEVILRVFVPRWAEIESVEIHRGDVDVSDIEGAVSVTSSNGDVMASRTGSLKVSSRNGSIIAREVRGSFVGRNFSGDVQIIGASGAVDISCFSGDIIARNIAGAVALNSTSGDIQIECAKDRVDVTAVSGTVTLAGIGGDVDANTTSGDVIFQGPIRPSGRYRLKSLSGEVSMSVQSDAPGFTATLATYSGEIETAFPLKLDSPLQGPVNRRVIGRYGDGRAQISLDSFSGAARITKGAAAKNCP